MYSGAYGDILDFMMIVTNFGLI